MFFDKFVINVAIRSYSESIRIFCFCFCFCRDLVHRDVKLDNVLVCRSDFSRVKLCDFGETRKAYTYVQRRNEWLPYSPPEVLAINTDQTYQ